MKGVGDLILYGACAIIALGMIIIGGVVYFISHSVMFALIVASLILVGVLIGVIPETRIWKSFIKAFRESA